MMHQFAMFTPALIQQFFHSLWCEFAVGDVDACHTDSYYLTNQWAIPVAAEFISDVELQNCVEWIHCSLKDAL